MSIYLYMYYMWFYMQKYVLIHYSPAINSVEHIVLAHLAQNKVKLKYKIELKL